MRASLKPRSIYDVFALIGCLAAVGGGTAYAANTIGSSDIVDESIQSVDIKNGEVKGADIGSNSITTNRIYPASVTNSDLGTSAVDSPKIANGSVTGSDIALHAIGQSKIDGTDHYGAIGVGGISNGRCTTASVSLGGAQSGDAGILTTDGTLPDGQTMYLQRVTDDAGQVKICNLSGGDLPAVNVNARILTFH